MDISIIGGENQPTLQLSGTTYEVALYKNDRSFQDISISDVDARKIAEELNQYIKEKNTYAEYSVHETLGSIMIKIHDVDTNEVIAEYPSEKIQDMIAKMCERAGIFMDKKA